MRENGQRKRMKNLEQQYKNMALNGHSLAKDLDSIAVLILLSKDGMENLKKMLLTKLLKLTHNHKINMNLNKQSTGQKEFENKKKNNRKNNKLFSKKNHKKLNLSNPKEDKEEIDMVRAKVEVEGTDLGQRKNQSRKI